MTSQHIQKTLEERLNDKFPCMGIAGDPKDNCVYRFDQYINDKSELLSFIENFLSQALTEQHEATIEEYGHALLDFIHGKPFELEILRFMEKQKEKNLLASLDEERG